MTRMARTVQIIRLGARRGTTQYLQIARSRDGFANTVFFNSLPLVAFILLRDSMVGDTGMSLAVFAMPGALAAMIVFGAVLNAAYYLSFEREDGTLLRMKALPGGMAGYVSGRVVQDSLDTIVGFTFVLIGGLILLPELAIGGITDLLLLPILVAFGLLATIPIGLIIGSVIRNPRMVFSLGVIVLAVLVIISGVWFPIQDLPNWLGAIAQLFPVYWLGIGLRSVFLPDAAAAIEIGGTWRTAETFAVLGAWAIGGLVATPRVLRRMSARESGSAVAGARERALQRG